LLKFYVKDIEKVWKHLKLSFKASDDRDLESFGYVIPNLIQRKISTGFLRSREVLYRKFFVKSIFEAKKSPAKTILTLQKR
jgi:hypothetical protein